MLAVAAAVLVVSAAPLASGALRPGPLAPGRHATTTFAPRLSFAVPRGWALAEEVRERRDSFLIRPLPPSLRAMAFFRVTRVYGDAANENSRPQRMRGDAVSVVAAHPALATSGPIRTRIGGFPTTIVDASVRSDVRDPYQRCAARRRCVFLFSTASGPVYLFQGKRVRFHFIRVAGATVVITAEALSDDFAAFAPAANRVVRSVRFGVRRR